MASDLLYQLVSFQLDFFSRFNPELVAFTELVSQLYSIPSWLLLSLGVFLYLHLWFDLNQLVSNLPSISGQTLHLSGSLSSSASEFLWINAELWWCAHSARIFHTSWLN
ncbi:hypothetical protein F511_27661 [Dorcoceras hygrometricum]|uniref:Uncharacterized protein n=1 Tax=Dorcoceras hygrometricum TaxID=472368 RepID=A0A2Z7AE88_9LAMI|nr:hypothetical protein F511_27661 [Dorcoceras hygrometricum]